MRIGNSIKTGEYGLAKYNPSYGNYVTVGKYERVLSALSITKTTLICLAQQ